MKSPSRSIPFAYGIPTLIYWVCVSSFALGDTTLTAQVGWGGRTRPGRWTQVLVTTSDDTPRNGILEIYSPHDASQAMKVQLPIAVGPTPRTDILYVPLLNSIEPTRLTLRDRSTGKILKEIVILDLYGVSEEYRRVDVFVNSNGPFMGVTGVGPALGSLDKNDTESPVVAFQREDLLPRTFRGFDALDVLVLNQPDFTGIAPEQQRAIADWVRAGGRLLVWPGENPVPPNGPLVDLLPGKIGGFLTVKVPPITLQAAGLSDRFGTFTARAFTPELGARVTHLLGDGGGMAVTAYRGLGKVTLVNFNVSALLFSDSNQQRFISSFIDLKANGDRPNSAAVQSNTEAQATGQLMDLMGDVPGVGTFGFGYVAVVMLCMMAIVGPIDWFVLKWMRRQPWTWLTTTGWIALLTTIALCIGSLFRSGELHFRTISLIDQVQDEGVSRNDMLGLYSPRSTEYEFKVQPATWWEPMTSDVFAYGRDVMRGIPFAQEENANFPVDDTVHVWNLRFLSGESAGQIKPVIGVDLWSPPPATQPSNGTRRIPRRVKGALTNLTDGHLMHLWLRSRSSVFDLTKDSHFPIGGLVAGESLQIDLSLTSSTPGYEEWKAPSLQAPVMYSRMPQQSTSQLTPLTIVRAASSMRAVGTNAIEERLNDKTDGTWVVIYGESEPKTGVVQLADEQPIIRNWQILRVLVRLKDGEPPTR